MALRDRLRHPATATSATSATEGPRVARVAKVAVAIPSNQDKSLSEVRGLIERVAALNPAYWTSEDIEEAVAVSARDLHAALETWRNVLKDNGGFIH